MKAKVNDLVAFGLFHDDTKLISGIVQQVHKNGRLLIETKSGKVYNVESDNIAWVSTNGRWPKKILLCLKGLAKYEPEEEKVGE